MEKNGYILFPGAFYRSKMWQKVPGDYVKAYIDLSFRVVHKECDYDCMFGKVHLKKGEMVTSYRHLAKLWGYSKCKVVCIVNFLKDNGLITIVSAGQPIGQQRVQYSVLKVNELDEIDRHLTGHLKGQDNNKNNNTSSKDEDIYRTKKFRKPTPEEVQAYLLQLHEFRMTGEQFCSYYDSVGWMVGRNKPMKSWKGCVRTWIINMNKGLFIQRNNERYISKQELAARQHEESVNLIRAELANHEREQDKLPF